jgi:hypothetical protein
MPKHKILVTWQNMDNTELADFIDLATKNSKDPFHRLYFTDANLGEGLRQVVAGVKADEPLRIYICGHGGAGHDEIRDDSRTQVKTLRDLTALLSHGLKYRPTSVNTSGLTRVDMISCLFGRSPDGRANTSSAAKLHQALITKGVYVDLVARTEIVTTTTKGRKTASPYQYYLAHSCGWKHKLMLTKVLHTFQGGSAISKLMLYDREDKTRGLDTRDLGARQYLWADYAVSVLVDLVRLDNSSPPNPRLVQLKTVLQSHDQADPQYLYAELGKLVDGTGTDEATNFLTHRNPLSRFQAWATEFVGKQAEVPKTAQVIRRLVRDYPLV